MVKDELILRTRGAKSGVVAFGRRRSQVSIKYDPPCFTETFYIAVFLVSSSTFIVTWFVF